MTEVVLPAHTKRKKKRNELTNYYHILLVNFSNFEVDGIVIIIGKCTVHIAYNSLQLQWRQKSESSGERSSIYRLKIHNELSLTARRVCTHARLRGVGLRGREREGMRDDKREGTEVKGGETDG